jgi:hypothetical protein
MVFYTSSRAHTVNKSASRLVDVMPTTMIAMGIAPTNPMDGKEYSLPTLP